MFNDKETRHWQQQYADGKIPQEWLDDCSGETLALLDGSADSTCSWIIGAGVGSLFCIMAILVVAFA